MGRYHSSYRAGFNPPPKISIFHLIGRIKMPLGRSPKLPPLLKWAPQCLPCQLNRHQLEILFLPSVSADKKIRLHCAHVIYVKSSSSFSIIFDVCSSPIVLFCVQGVAVVNMLQFGVIFSSVFFCVLDMVYVLCAQSGKQSCASHWRCWPLLPPNFGQNLQTNIVIISLFSAILCTIFPVPF